MTTNNDTRAKRAQSALQSYVEAKGEVFENNSSEIADLIADLLHLAAGLLEGENTAEETVERCLRLALMHFEAEYNNPEEEIPLLNTQPQGASPMTKIYLIHAWCERPFISYLDPVEAASPEQAIAIARTQQKELLDNAEECNTGYLWDKFAAFDEHGNEVLRVLDDEARLHNAAPAMRDTLLYAAQERAGFKPDHLRQLGLNALLEHVEKALAIADNTVIGTTAPATADDLD